MKKKSLTKRQTPKRKKKSIYKKTTVEKSLVKEAPITYAIDQNVAQLKLFQTETESKRYKRRIKHNQYFTPKFAVEKAFSLLPRKDFKYVIDPAVGDGVFLKVASKTWANAKLFGIDIDEEIIFRLRKQHIRGSHLLCANSLEVKSWQRLTGIKNIVSNGGFDLVVGNPPFSSWFNRIKEPKILSNFELAHRDGKMRKSQAMELLFLEKFIRLVKRGGFIVVVLPDGILSNPQYGYIRNFILINTKVKWVLSLPRNIFKETSAKTSILILEKKGNTFYTIHYHSKIADLQQDGTISNIMKVVSEGLRVRMDFDFYKNLQISSVKELINKGIPIKPLREFVTYFKTGKTLYGNGRKFVKKGLRFLHATNISDIGINYTKDERFIEPKSKMDSPSAHAVVGDILFTRVGVGCAGRVAIVDHKGDEGVATDYLHIIRVKEINPYFLVIYLKTKFGRDSINLLKHGVGTISINKSDVLSIPILIVSNKLQKVIEQRYKRILRNHRKTIEERAGFEKIQVSLDSLTKFLENKLERIN